MIKNWFVKTKQIKEKGYINHCFYLSDTSRASHFQTRIKILNDSAKNILHQFDQRKLFRSKNKLKGKNPTNIGTSFVVSLPKNINQPNDKQWKKIALYAIKKLSDELDIDYEKLVTYSFAR